MRTLLTLAALAMLVVPAAAQYPQLEMCSNRRNIPDKTGLVDGDTLWLQGENIRLKDFDTPEPQTAICGGNAEVDCAPRRGVTEEGLHACPARQRIG